MNNKKPKNKETTETKKDKKPFKSDFDFFKLKARAHDGKGNLVWAD